MSSCITDATKPPATDGTRVTRMAPPVCPQMDREYEDGAKTKSPRAWLSGLSVFAPAATNGGTTDPQGEKTAQETELSDLFTAFGGDEETEELDDAAFAGRRLALA